MKVLVVDDAPDMVASLQGVLELHGLEVFTAKDGREAARMLNRGLLVDAICSDYQMPEWDGAKLLRWVREAYVNHEVPFFMFSGIGNEVRARMIAAGATAVFEKPDSRPLVDHLRKLKEMAAR